MDLLDATTTQRPLDVLVLLSYPVSLSAAAAASVWTWLAVAVAGVWIRRLISHQSAAASRAKEDGTVFAASHLLPPDASTACLLQQQRRPQSTLPCSPCPEDEEEERSVEEIEPACDCPIPVPAVDIHETFRKKAVVYFEGHGGRCCGSSAPVRKQDQDEQDQDVEPSSARQWFDEATITGCSSPDHHGCNSTKVVCCWDDVHHEADQEERDTTDYDAVTVMTAYSRMSDLGFRGFQDWGVINGNVVRLWHVRTQHLVLLPAPAPAAARSRAGAIAVASPLALLN